MANYVGSNRPRTVLMRLCEDIDTPRSLAIFLCAKYNDFDALTGFDINPLNYNDHRSYALDRQATDFLKKSCNLANPDREAKTVEIFLKAEEQCRVTNERLLRHHEGDLADALSIMRGKIASIVNDPTSPSGLPARALDFSHGPGTSSQVRGKDTAFYSKFAASPLDITPHAYEFAKQFLNGTLWDSFLERTPGPSFRLRAYSGTMQVPKNFKVNRMIAVEPTGNIYFQKGIGGWIRDRLRLVGVDLRRQELNQDAAGRAHVDKLATVDFSSASDTISYMCVSTLLPIGWFQVLDCFRTHYAKFPDGVVRPLQKFSSMGNGFTFELESLIFYSAAFAAVKLGSGRLYDINVYGDDVILPSEDYPLFRRLCEYLGFSINLEKSFVSGRFFESCGKDFFDGYDVRPNYLKNSLTDDFDIFTCHNRLLLFFQRWGLRTTKALNFLQSLVPSHRTYFVPVPYDGGFWPHREKHVTKWFAEDENGWEGVWARRLVFLSRKKQNTVFEPALLHSLLSPSDGFRTIRGQGDWVVRRTFFPRIV